MVVRVRKNKPNFFSLFLKKRKRKTNHEDQLPTLGIKSNPKAVPVKATQFLTYQIPNHGSFIINLEVDIANKETNEKILRSTKSLLRMLPPSRIQTLISQKEIKPILRLKLEQDELKEFEKNLNELKENLNSIKASETQAIAMENNKEFTLRINDKAIPFNYLIEFLEKNLDQAKKS